MANLLPTKGNLIAAKRSRMLAQTGYELMDRKRNILIRELMGMMDTAKELQGQIDAVFTEAYRPPGGQHPPGHLRPHRGGSGCGRLPDPALPLRYGGGAAPHPRPVPPAPAGVRHGGYLLRAG